MTDDTWYYFVLISFLIWLIDSIFNTILKKDLNFEFVNKSIRNSKNLISIYFSLIRQILQQK